MGGGKTSPISAVDVARAVALILDDPAPHIGQIYDLTGPESANLDHYAQRDSCAAATSHSYHPDCVRECSRSVLGAVSVESTADPGGNIIRL